MYFCCLWEGVFILRVVVLITGDDGAHSTNEKLDLSNYISGNYFGLCKVLMLGIKLLGAYLQEIAAMESY
jgi:hypothetical protein